MSEVIVLDPLELAPRRKELSLEQLGIHIDKEGADWGESQVAVQLARQMIGSTVTDRHLEPVEMTIPLLVKKEGAVKLATVAHLLQQKVGIWQANELEPNWIRRDFDAGGNFAGSVAYIVHSAALHGLQGWFLANRAVAKEVTLKVLRSPLSYATAEVELEAVKEEVARALQFEAASMLGTGPGLMRLRIKDLNAGAAHYRGLLVAMESRDHPQDATKTTTAALLYEAEKLTLGSGAAEAERAGASGGNKVVRHATLTGGFVTVLSSKIVASGHMTHRGTRRVWARIYDPGAAAGAVELRLQFRPLGASRWSETNVTVPTPLVGNFCLVDLGECRPELAALGLQRWEWRLQARAPSGSGTIDIDQIYICPVEQYSVLSAPAAVISPDLSSTKSPVTAENKAEGGTVAWTTPANAVSSNNAYATMAVAAGQQKESQFLQVSNFGFAIPEGATITGIVVEVERKAKTNAGPDWVFDADMVLMKAGVRQVSGGGKDKAELYVGWPTVDTYKAYGGSTDLWANTWTPADVNNAGFGAAFRCVAQGSAGEQVASVDHIRVIVYYTTVTDDNRVCFAARSIELRSDGVFRQHETDDVWGPLVPEGFNPYAPPSYMEGRALRGLVLPSQGDLGVLHDGTSNKIEARVIYRPAYHFAREAV